MQIHLELEILHMYFVQKYLKKMKQTYKYTGSLEFDLEVCVVNCNYIETGGMIKTMNLMLLQQQYEEVEKVHE